MVLLWIIGATLIVSLLSLFGVITLIFKEKLLDKILLLLVAFSAGALMGGAFLHLIPESIEISGQIMYIFLYLLLGYTLFFVLEQFIHWHHCHKVRHEIKAFSYLNLIGDGVHNFIDGLIIAGSFLVNVNLGIVTTLAVALHEIPQEVGDFGVLVYGGMKKVRALEFNFLMATTAILGGILGFFLAGFIGGSTVFLLPFAAGNFIYIASSDLIPEIKNKESLKKSLLHFFVFVLGIFFMLLIKLV
jgi:zinc and cadmium transporter